MTLKFSHDDQNKERYGYCRHGMIVSVIHMQVPILPPFVPITYPTGMNGPRTARRSISLLSSDKRKKGPTNVGAIDKMLFPYCETVDQ